MSMITLKDLNDFSDDIIKATAFDAIETKRGSKEKA
jgi:hypothetical protein